MPSASRRRTSSSRGVSENDSILRPGRLGGRRLGRRAERLAQEPGLDRQLAVADRGDHRQDLGRRRLLEQVAGGAAADRLEHVVAVVVHGHDHDGDRVVELLDLGQAGEAVDPGHADVEQHDVRAPGGDLGQARFCSCRPRPRPRPSRPSTASPRGRARDISWSSTSSTRVGDSAMSMPHAIGSRVAAPVSSVPCGRASHRPAPVART